FNTGLFFKNVSTFSNLRDKAFTWDTTERFDTDSEISYPTKVGILEFKPYVGGRNTYYSRTAVAGEKNEIRGFLKSGASLSTKFFKIYNVETDAFGINIHKLRHIITPSIDYSYTS